MVDDEDRGGSAPCFMHELGDGPSGAPVDAQTRTDVLRWRKGERQRLIEARLALPADVRAAMSRRIAEALDAQIGKPDGRSVGFCWPFRGEPDLRDWIGRFVGAGGRAALPVVVEKGRPLTFRSWAPGEPLEKGVWNIPIPAGGEEVLPDIAIAPVVGFDSTSYRLGYGGGFFDRTLAGYSRRPLVIGVGYEMQRIATIFPLPHDIAMDFIVTENGRAGQ